MSSEASIEAVRSDARIEAYPGRTVWVDGAAPAPLHLGVGMFDGVHLGHERVIQEAIDLGREPGHWSAVLTFDPHPARILRPEAAPKLLMSLSERVEQLLRLGLTRVFVHRFTPLFAQVEGEAFVRYLKHIFPALQSLHVGENFRFGAGRRGDGPLLVRTAEAEGLRAFVHPPLCVEDGCVSSSRIREAIQAGRMEEAASLLGRAHRVGGPVVEGRQIGRTFGIPTLNLRWSREVCPPLGVYAVWCYRVGETEAIPAIANLGVRPSFGVEKTPVLEVHLLGCQVSGWPVPGDEIEVEFGRFIRPELTFAAPEDLRSQILRDIEEVKRAFALTQLRAEGGGAES